MLRVLLLVPSRPERQRIAHSKEGGRTEGGDITQQSEHADRFAEARVPNR
jgi:hypothetical protein